MKKALRREIGIKRFKKEGLNYPQIGGKIRLFKIYVESSAPENPFTMEVTPEYTTDRKIHWWQKVWMRGKIWIENFILKIKRREEKK